MESRTRVDLPSFVTEPYEVFINGVPQAEGTDYQAIGATLVFERPLEREGEIGFWRWARMFFGVAGTYRKNDAIDVVYTAAGRRSVVSLKPVPLEPVVTEPAGGSDHGGVT